MPCTWPTRLPRVTAFQCEYGRPVKARYGEPRSRYSNGAEEPLSAVRSVRQHRCGRRRVASGLRRGVLGLSDGRRSASELLYCADFRSPVRARRRNTLRYGASSPRGLALSMRATKHRKIIYPRSKNPPDNARASIHEGRFMRRLVVRIGGGGPAGVQHAHPWSRRLKSHGPGAPLRVKRGLFGRTP